ncbi:hypothetical protein KKH36_03830 [Patescibacteria group bacterium]|nr:hypothetical protein [Patescibacteria group bacterium]
MKTKQKKIYCINCREKNKKWIRISDKSNITEPIICNKCGISYNLFSQNKDDKLEELDLEIYLSDDHNINLLNLKTISKDCESEYEFYCPFCIQKQRLTPIKNKEEKDFLTRICENENCKKIFHIDYL